ncbi:MAG TPA: protein kinase, partial [Terriglobia bacterium]|nr:protein kinase [Terriglobia bacterium]
QGFDPVINRTVAIKTMLLEGFSSADYEEYKKRFQREAQAAGVLSHPNIVTVHDFGEDNGVLYLAMEFLKGVSLEDLLRRQKRMPAEDVVRLFEQVCSALDHAHSHQVVHRDMKPANIMLLDNGQAKVTDFGIARLLSSGTGMTRVGQVVGTPSYMSPEQVKGLPVDGRSDIFSLGVILYLLLTGKKPFEGPSLTTIIYKIVNEDPVPPSEVDANLLPSLSVIVGRALAKDPKKRYQTCRELAEDLRNYKTLADAATAVTTAAPGAAMGQSDRTAGIAKPAGSVATQAVPPQPAPRAMPAASAPVRESSPAPQPRPAARRSGIIVGIAVVAVLVLAGIFGRRFITSRQPETPAQSPAQSSSPGTTPGPSPSSSPGSAAPSDSTAGAAQGAAPANTQPTVSVPPSQGGATTGAETGASAASSGPGSAHPARPAQPAAGENGSRPSRDNPRTARGPEVDKAHASQAKTQSGAPANSAQPTESGSQAAAQQTTAAPGNPPPQASAPATSQLIVETNPPGYDVFVDGQSYGRSDQPVVANITPGQHVLTLKKDGAEAYRKTFTQTTDTHSMTINPLR